MNLKIEILRTLDRFGSKSYPEPALLHELRMTLPEPIQTNDFDTTIRELQNRRYIVGGKPALSGPDDPVRWKITNEGKLALDSALSGT